MKTSMAIFRRGLIVAAAVLLVASFGCSKKTETPAPKPEKEEILLTSDSFYPILGKAEAEVSGAADVQVTPEQVQVQYHFVLPEGADFTKVFGQHMAPKIRAMYQSIKGIDLVSFDVFIPASGAEPWKQRLHFAVDRKLIQETDWTKLLDVDFFTAVKDLKEF